MDHQLNRQLAIGNRQIWLLIAYCLLHTAYSFSQNYSRSDTIPVKIGVNTLQNPWTGGHNYVQLSDIDMNFDGKKDLFVFDRSGHKVTAYINKGTPNTVDYVDSTFKYASKFPHLEDWALVRDYNCDGKPDIFTYAITVGGIKVWKNTSSGGNLQFTLEKNYLFSDYTPTITTDPLSNLYITRVDIPSIDDIDGDGDTDVLTFDYSSTSVEFHINQSKEKGYNCDSLIFILDPNGCWGNFQESSSNCGINLSSCRKQGPSSPPPVETQRQELHTGSCTVCMDMDADGDKDILIGDISCCSMNLLTNGGSPASANITAKDTSFPSNDIPVKMNLFPCGYFLDVDNDNKRDLVVCPNAPNVSVDIESIWFYKNIGTDLAPVFKRVKRNLLQDQMIDVGEGADPVFFDFDTDGLTDLLISNYVMIKDSCPASAPLHGVHAYKNTGTSTQPKFEFVTSDYAGLNTSMVGIPSKHLTFGDVDNDGDKDLFIGDYNGNIHYLSNTATPTTPAAFTYVALVTDVGASTVIDVGNYSTPQLIDADRDGDLDLLVGERAGNLNLYDNIGTASSFTFDLASANFGGVDVKKACCTGHSVPFMYDSSGKYNLIVASESIRNYPETGWLWYFKDIDANLLGNFTFVDSTYNDIWEGERMTIHGADINGDALMDLSIGNYAGGVSIYLGNGIPNSIAQNTTPQPELQLYPNPATGSFSVEVLNFIPGKKYELIIYNSLGAAAHSLSLESARTRIETALSQGVYSVQVKGNGCIKTKRLIIVK